jgi:hypothetical protein
LDTLRRIERILVDRYGEDDIPAEIRGYDAWMRSKREGR